MRVSDWLGPRIATINQEWHRRNGWCDENILLLVVVIAWLDTRINSYGNVHFKWLRFTECNVSLTMLSKQILRRSMKHWSEMMWKLEEIQWTFWAFGFFHLQYGLNSTYYLEINDAA